jgi:hypothetical protein
MRESLKTAMIMGHIGGEGVDRVTSFGEFLRKEAARTGHPELLNAMVEFEQADETGKARIHANVSGGGGLGSAEAAYHEADVIRQITGGGFSSMGARHAALGRGIMKGLPAITQIKAEKDREDVGWIAGGIALATGLGALFAPAVKDVAERAVGAGATPEIQAKAIGRFLDSEKGRNLGLEMLDTSAAVRTRAARANDARLLTLRKRLDTGQASVDDKGEFSARVSMRLAQGVKDIEASDMDPETKQAALEALAMGHGLSVKGVQELAGSAGAVTYLKKLERVSQAAERIGERTTRQLERMTVAGGIYQMEEGGDLALAAEFVEDLGGARTAGARFAAGMMRSQEVLSGMRGGLENVEADSAAMYKARKLHEYSIRKMGKMTTQEREDYIAGTRGRVGGAAGRRLVMDRDRTMKTLGQAYGAYGKTKALAGLLGGGFGKKDAMAVARGLQTGKIESADVLERMLKKEGLELEDLDEETREELTGAFEALKGGGKRGDVKAAAGMEAARAGLYAARQEKRKEQQEADDPLSAEMNRSLSTIAKATSKFDTMVSQLGTIANNTAEGGTKSEGHDGAGGGAGKGHRRYGGSTGN